jgi:chemotaxis protein MotB
MPRRRHLEEHSNQEAWAIPYGDLITLLLAFFVVMYSMSSVNEGKYRILSDALNAEFRGAPRSDKPIQVGEKKRGDSSGESAIDNKALLHGPSEQVAAPVVLDNPEINQQRESQPQQENKPPLTTPEEDVAGNAQELNKVADDVEQAMASLIHEKLVAVRRHGLWVEVEIQTDILFPSGVAALPPFAVSVLAPLADAIKPFPNPVRVEGHTDNVPINKREFPSNWELSAARAASVVHLFSNRGVEPARLTVIGLGEFRPLKSNATAEGRSANRRVVLVILGRDGLPLGTYGHQANAAADNKAPTLGAPNTTLPAAVAQEH